MYEIEGPRCTSAGLGTWLPGSPGPAFARTVCSSGPVAGRSFPLANSGGVSRGSRRLVVLIGSRRSRPTGPMPAPVSRCRPRGGDSEELLPWPADRSRRGRTFWMDTGVGRGLPLPSPPELPPGGPPVVLGVGVVLVPVSPVAQGVSAKFLDQFSGHPVVHRMCTACPPRTVRHPHVVPRSVHRWVVHEEFIMCETR